MSTLPIELPFSLFWPVRYPGSPMAFQPDEREGSVHSQHPLCRLRSAQLSEMYHQYEPEESSRVSMGRQGKMASKPIARLLERQAALLGLDESHRAVVH